MKLSDLRNDAEGVSEAEQYDDYPDAAAIPFRGEQYFRIAAGTYASAFGQVLFLGKNGSFEYGSLASA
jgi:hypothetical protein